MGRTKKMTEGNPAILMISFAFPLMLANFGQQLYMIVDAMIVGKGVGVEALAAVGATDWSYWLVLWTVQALTQGFAIPVSQYFGEGNQENVRKAVTMSVRLCLAAGILLTVVSFIFALPLLRLLQTPEDIFSGSSAYLLTMYGGILVVIAFNMASSILRAFGDGKTPMIAMAIAAGTNVLLDLLFVLVFQWGIVGAAVATLAAQLLAFLYCFLSLRKFEWLKPKKADWNRDRDIINSQCRLGIPLALQHMLIAVGGMILQSVINRQGFVFIAGFTATNKIYGLLESSAISLGYAVTTYMAQNYGGGLPQRIRSGLKSASVLAILLSAAISAAMIWGGRIILSLFIAQDNANAASVLEIAYHYLFIMSCLLSSLYLLYVFRNTLQSLGNATASLWSGIGELLARVSAACVLTRLAGTEALFYAEPLAWISAMLIVAVVCLKRVCFDLKETQCCQQQNALWNVTNCDREIEEGECGC